MKHYIIIVFLLMYQVSFTFGQENLMGLLEANSEPVIQYAEATFKGSRLINGHTVITRKNNELEFLISHRFGLLNSGAYELFGLDNSNVRLGLEYGVSNRFTVGVGRNSFEKTYDGLLKYNIIKQQKGALVLPVSVTLFSSMAVKTIKQEAGESNRFDHKLTYCWQALIARKFSPGFSLQVMPTLVHYNLAQETNENDQYALGIGGRIKLSKRISLNTEYYYRLNHSSDDRYHNSLAVGFDIETGGHVFQLHLTNSRAMIEKGFITETEGDISNGDFHFGFNISRVF